MKIEVHVGQPAFGVCLYKAENDDWVLLLPFILVIFLKERLWR
jgi:hypothetical protein